MTFLCCVCSSGQYVFWLIIRIDFRDDDFFVLYVVSFHVAGAAGRDKVIIRLDSTDDDFFVLRMQQWTVRLLVVCGLSHASRAAGRDKVIIRIDCTDDDFFLCCVCSSGQYVFWLCVVCLMLHEQRDVTR